VVIWTDQTATPGLLVALLVAVGWDYVFAKLRHRRFQPFGITTAMIFALFAPVDIPLWHLVVVLSLGCGIGELVFGGRGFSFASPATVSLALLLLALPGVVLRAPTEAMALSCLPGAALLLATGLLSLRTVFAFAVTLGALFGVAAMPDALALACAVSVSLLFLVSDPTTGAVTGPGRLAHGAFAGGLVWVFGGSGAGIPPPDALVFAALLASLFAPLLDHIAIALTASRRRAFRD
jgi:Na+-transporting NADH:ubiquinone oxidoreductase subunit B